MFTARADANFAHKDDGPFDLTPVFSARRRLVKFDFPRRSDNEEVEVCGRVDHLVSAADRERRCGQGTWPEGGVQRCDVLQVVVEVRRHGGVGRASATVA